MDPCCGLGKALYFLCMLISVLLSATALYLPKWTSGSHLCGFSENYPESYGFLDSCLDGPQKVITLFGAICFAILGNLLAFINFAAFGLACSRPTQCYLAMRRSTILACYVFSQYTTVLIIFAIESMDSLDLSYYILVAADIAAFFGIICGFITSQIMYNALKRDWNRRYGCCSFCLPY